MSINTSSEELRKLLASDPSDFSPSPTIRRGSQSSASQELGSLLTSFNTNELSDLLQSPVMKRSTAPTLSTAPSLPKPSYSGASSLPSTSKDVAFTVLKYGTQCSLRCRTGRYLAAELVTTSPTPSLPSSTTLDTPFPSSSSTHSSSFYSLSVEGQGTGDVFDAITAVNVDSREDQGPIKYGSIIALKAPAAKERLLGIREGSKLGFWRNLIGQGEKWMILKASSKGFEEPHTRGSFVQLGDAILLSSSSSSGPHSSRSKGLSSQEELLSVYEGVHGREARMVHVDRAGLGDEVFYIDLFNSQPLPSWSNRKYLNGSFLTQPFAARQPAADVLARTFPGAPVAPMPTTTTNDYSSLPAPLQQRILVRELLLALTGVEGDVVRVIESPGAGLNKGINLRKVKLTIDTDIISDHSLSNHLSMLLPTIEAVIRIRSFILTQSRYEFGYVSHAAAAGLKAILRELDILIAQLENQMLTSRLSIHRG